VTTDPDIEARLDRLEQESVARTAELKALATELPSQLGRRALLRTLSSDLRATLDVRALLARARWALSRRARAVWSWIVGAIRPIR
jgi:hypothetical protein